MTPPPPPPSRPWKEKRRRSEERRRSRHRMGRAIDLLRRGAALVPVGLAAAVGDAAGLLAWAIFGRSRRRAVRQMAEAPGAGIPPGERGRVARGVFRGFGRSIAEALAASGRGLEAFEARLSVEGEEHLRAATADGRGAVLVSGHFGNFELLGGFLARRCNLRAVARTSRGDAADAAIAVVREGLGVRTMAQGSARAVLRALEEGVVVAVLPDQDIDRLDGEFLPFLGRPAYTPTGPAVLALGAGAAVLPAFLRREGRRFVLAFHPPAFPDPAAPDRASEVRRLTRAWTEAVEMEIRARPDHWAWFHRRWRTTPERLEARRNRRSRTAAERAAVAVGTAR